MLCEDILKDWVYHDVVMYGLTKSAHPRHGKAAS